MKKITGIFLVLLFSFSIAYAQKGKEKFIQVTIKGQVYEAMIQGKDTIILAEFGEGLVVDYQWKSNEERSRYNKLKYYGKIVYPYAVEMIKAWREIEIESDGYKKRARKKLVREKEEIAKTKFEKKLKNLTKTQGKLLVDMVERELDVSMYQILKHLKGGGKAFYFNSIGKIYGYNLKNGYDPERDPLLEAVLLQPEFDLSNVRPSSNNSTLSGLKELSYY